MDTYWRFIRCTQYYASSWFWFKAKPRWYMYWAMGEKGRLHRGSWGCPF